MAPNATLCSVSRTTANDDRPSWCAERQPDTDLGGPLRHAVGDNGVDADGGQCQQQRPEHHEHARRHATQKQVPLDVLCEGANVIDRQRLVDLPDDTPNITRDGYLGAGMRPHVDFSGGRRAIAIREVDDGSRWLAEGFVE